MAYPVFFIKDWEDKYLTRQPIARSTRGTITENPQMSQVLLAPRAKEGIENQLWKFEVNDLDSIVPYWAPSSNLEYTYFEIYHGGWLYMTTAQQPLKVSFRKNQLCVNSNNMALESRYDKGMSRQGVLLMPSKDVDEQRWSLEYVDDLKQRQSVQ